MQRRRDKRKKEQNKVIIEFVLDDIDSGNERDINALTHDISISGARILINRVFPVGTVLRITLDLSKSKQIVKLDGKVKWVKNLNKEYLYEMGLEFMHDIHKSVLVLIAHLYGEK